MARSGSRAKDPPLAARLEEVPVTSLTYSNIETRMDRPKSVVRVQVHFRLTKTRLDTLRAIEFNTLKKSLALRELHPSQATLDYQFRNSLHKLHVDPCSTSVMRLHLFFYVSFVFFDLRVFIKESARGVKGY